MKPGKICGCGADVPAGRYKCDECRRRRSIAREGRKSEKKNPPKSCAGCGKLFRALHGRGKLPFCLECRPIGSRCTLQRQREKEARWEKTGAERAAKKAADEAARLERMKAAAAKRAAREAEKAAKIAACPWMAPGLPVGEKWRLRYRNDPLFNVSERVRNQMRSRRRFKNMEYTIRKAVAGKVTTPGIEKFLGYTMADLRKHLEARFDDFMCWEDFAAGHIQIDHRRPVASFDLDDPDQVRECWALDNLQPLWRPDNMRKGAKILEGIAA